jgi:hypothetical protein
MKTETSEQTTKAPDTLGAFLAAHCELQADAEATVADLFERFEDWCESTGAVLVSRRAFGLALLERGFNRRESNGRVLYAGIALRAATATADRDTPAEAAPEPSSAASGDDGGKAGWANSGEIGHPARDLNPAVERCDTAAAAPIDQSTDRPVAQDEGQLIAAVNSARARLETHSAQLRDVERRQSLLRSRLAETEAAPNPSLTTYDQEAIAKHWKAQATKIRERLDETSAEAAAVSEWLRSDRSAVTAAEDALAALKRQQRPDQRRAIAEARRAWDASLDAVSATRRDLVTAQSAVNAAEREFAGSTGDADAWTRVQSARSERDRLALRETQLAQHHAANGAAVDAAETALQLAEYEAAERTASADEHQRAIGGELDALAEIQSKLLTIAIRLEVREAHRYAAARAANELAPALKRSVVPMPDTASARSRTLRRALAALDAIGKDHA